MTIDGAAGPFAGSGMKGGTLAIEGDAGERLGGPLSGETVGMSGGLIHVRGDAGERAGDRLRRGFILIEGRAGAYAGSRMIAGTLAIGGEAGELPGYLMGRGTILSAGARRFSRRPSPIAASMIWSPRGFWRLMSPGQREAGAAFPPALQASRGRSGRARQGRDPAAAALIAPRLALTAATAILRLRRSRAIWKETGMTAAALSPEQGSAWSATDRAPLLRWLIFTGVTVFAAVLLWRYGLIRLMVARTAPISLR